MHIYLCYGIVLCLSRKKNGIFLNFVFRPSVCQDPLRLEHVKV